MNSEKDKQQDAVTLDYCEKALRLVCLSLPYLSGLAHNVAINVDRRVPTAGVFASGRMVVNPDFIMSLKPTELTFILAHELLHLALDTHGRGAGAPPKAVNIAHDYIINDILSHALGQEVPAGGLTQEGAREFSLEDLLSRGVSWQGKSCWRTVETPGGLTDLGKALVDAGLAAPPEPQAEDDMILDVLSAAQEREWYPELTPLRQKKLARDIKNEAAKANGLKILKDRLEQDAGRQPSVDDGDWSDTVEALKTSYSPSWELALQRWFDATGPGERSYARPSRRGQLPGGIVLPGRKREGRTMHIVLDTSGSMVVDLPPVLGIIGSFCENNDVGEVHILQCDVRVTADEWVAPEELRTYEIRGMGGSDMSPALEQLAEDPEVQTAIVITDGMIDYPNEEPPYHVLWAVIDVWNYNEFSMPYGTVVMLPVDDIRGA